MVEEFINTKNDEKYFYNAGSLLYFLSHELNILFQFKKKLISAEGTEGHGGIWGMINIMPLRDMEQ